MWPISLNDKELTSLLLINIWFASTFTQHLDSPPSNSIIFFSLFISLQCCYNIDIALRYYFLFLEGRGGIDGSCDAFS